MFCKKCGRQLKSNAKFCPHCGEGVESVSLPAETGDGRRSKFLGGLVIAAASCAFAVVIGVVAFVYLNGRDNQDETKPTVGYEETSGDAEAAVKESTKAPLESTEEVSDSVEEPDIFAVLAAYQQYADGFSEEGDLRYSLIYINEDSVPECLIWFGSREIRFLSYIDHSIIVFEPEYIGGHMIEVAYTPRSGEFAVNQSYGVGGMDYTLAELSNVFEVKMRAETNGGFDSPGHWNAGYDINSEPVDEDTYFAQTDLSRFQQMIDTLSPAGTYETILSAYSALTSPEPPAVPEASEFVLPESNLRYMTYDDLKGIDSVNLRIAKNEIYARHGRMFQSEDLSRYFNSKSWYSGTIQPDRFSDNVFNDFESGNISMIQYFQDGTPSGNYYAFAFQYKYFKIDSGVLTVFVSPTSWSGNHSGYALSLPMSDDCIWWRELEQKPYTGAEDGISRIISDERARYQESPGSFEDPIGLSVEVEGGVVVGIKVYVS